MQSSMENRPMSIEEERRYVSTCGTAVLCSTYDIAPSHAEKIFTFRRSNDAELNVLEPYVHRGEHWSYLPQPIIDPLGELGTFILIPWIGEGR